MATVADTQHIVMLSGGAASWATAKRVAAKHGTKNLHLWFADTSMEDESLYKFVSAAAEDVGGELHIYRDGRTPWDVFKDTRMLGNSMFDPCSRILKREPARKFMQENFTPETAIIYLGLTWDEIHRLKTSRKAWTPWQVEAPLCDEMVWKPQVLKELRASGLPTQRLYELGFPHNNCGGFCIKAGIAHFKLLYETIPNRFAEHESKEQAFRKWIEKDVSILRDRSGGKTTRLTLTELRGRIETDKAGQLDLLDWGGCGCFVDEEELEGLDIAEHGVSGYTANG